MDHRTVALSLLVTLAGAGGVVATTDVLSLDDDGLTVVEELQQDTDPLHPDTDRDGLNDSAEINVHATDPLDPDSDGDGLNDNAEVTAHGTDPQETDSDADGLDDEVEIEQYETDPLDADSDDDNLDDAREVDDLGTDPTAADSDGDGLGDNGELEAGTDPLDSDSDNDRLGDGEETHQYRTDPLDPDTDGDGLSDGAEVNDHRTDPTSRDSDADGLEDGDELDEHGTDPTEADTDDDGLDDDREIDDLGTDPTDADTDGDGLPDGPESSDSGPVSAGDPLRMDMFVELDYMHDQRPLTSSIQAVKQAYADAPLENPDGSTGIALHVVIDDELPRESKTTPDDRDRLRNEHFDRSGQGYHHAIAVYDAWHDENDVAGFGRPGRFVFQTRYTTGWAAGRRVSSDAVASIFMHELGHSAGLSSLDFRGIDSDEFSYSEYRSVMNYDAPGDALGYNTGGPFDDWLHIELYLYTPPTDDIERAS